MTLHRKKHEPYVYAQRSEANNKGKQRRFLELFCEYNKLEPHEAHDVQMRATLEKAPIDAVYRTGHVHNGKYSPGRWICAWEMSPSNPFIDWAHGRIEEERVKYEQRAEKREVRRSRVRHRDQWAQP